MTRAQEQGGHAAGPWVARDAGSGYPIHVTTVDTAETVCRIGGHASAISDDEQNEANARLIASAPALLAEVAALREALTRLLRAFEADTEQVPSLDVLTAWETNSDAIAQARAALALSEGRAP